MCYLMASSIHRTACHNILIHCVSLQGTLFCQNTSCSVHSALTLLWPSVIWHTQTRLYMHSSGNAKSTHTKCVWRHEASMSTVLISTLGCCLTTHAGTTVLLFYCRCTTAGGALHAIQTASTLAAPLIMHAQTLGYAHHALSVPCAYL